MMCNHAQKSTKLPGAGPENAGQVRGTLDETCACAWLAGMCNNVNLHNRAVCE